MKNQSNPFIRTAAFAAFSLAITATPVHALTRTWDGGGGSALWTTAANWDADTLPAAGNDVVIDTAVTVDMSGLGSGFLPSGVKVALTNGSTLTNSTSVVRMNGASSLSVGSGCTFNKYMAMGSGSMSFQNGAVWNAGDVELAGPNVFSFKLGAAGFTKLTPSTLRWNATTKFSQQTWNVDMADYTGPSPASIILMDCSSASDANMTSALWLAQATRNVTNAGANVGSTIVYDPIQAAFVLKVQVASYVPPVADLVWDGGGASVLWATATNWDPDFIPATGNSVAIASPVTVEYTGNLPACTLSLTNSGGLKCSSGAIRLQGATINVASGSALTANYWDMNNGTINFQNGAVATMNDWELKGTNRFTFKLGATGFTKLNPNVLRGPAPTTTISNSTWVADMASYTGGPGIIPLVDYTTDGFGLTSAVFLGATRTVTNAAPGYTANIEWDNTTKAVVLNVTAAPGYFTAYWDNDGATAGFGTATGTWAAPTTGNGTQGWSTDATGSTLPVDVTTSLTSAVNFGNGATGLGAGTIAVSGTVASGNITFASGSGAIVLSGGTINLPAAGVITTDNTTDTINSVLGGAATSLTKAGSGTLSLTGANTYAGATTINGGILTVTNAASLGSTSGNTVVSSGYTLRIEGGITIAEPLNITGAGVAGSGAIKSAGNNTLTGAVVSSGGRLQTEGLDTMMLTGGITSTGTSILVGAFAINSNPLVAGANAIQFAGDGATIPPVTGKTIQLNVAGNTWSDALLFFSAIVKLGVDNAMPSTATVRMGFNTEDNSRSTLDLNGHIQTVASIETTTPAVAGTFISITGGGTLTVNQPASSKTFTGIISDGATPTALTKTGVGTLTLSAANTYTGDTTVSNGVLAIAATGSLSDNSAVKLNIGGMLNLATGVNDTVKSLVIDGGAPKGPGTYGSSTSGAANTGLGVDPDDYFSGNGIITVPAGGSPYNIWAGGFPGFTPTTGTLDFENDGIQNLLEFVLGGNPTTNDSPSIRPSVSASGSDLVVTFNRTDLSETQPVTVKVQTSPDLVIWTDFATIGATDGSGYTVAENAAAADAIVVTIPKAAAARKFARVTAE